MSGGGKPASAVAQDGGRARDTGDSRRRGPSLQLRQSRIDRWSGNSAEPSRSLAVDGDAFPIDLHLVAGLGRSVPDLPGEGTRQVDRGTCLGRPHPSSLLP